MLATVLGNMRIESLAGVLEHQACFFRSFVGYFEPSWEKLFRSAGVSLACLAKNGSALNAHIVTPQLRSLSQGAEP